MSLPTKRTRKSKPSPLSVVISVAVEKNTKKRIEAFRATLLGDASRSSVHRYLILKGLEAVEKEAARG